ncbi:MAG TPA: hypothetical protein VL693_18370 [Vicinamibacterales bacterium]|jgi:hypothetical protein|nr:hypothetical protein [Vicinamibacterales bacterium]
MKRFSRFLIAAGVFTMMTGVAAAQDAKDKYLTEARAHQTMASTYIGNPNHPMDANMAVHCKALADLAAAKAERARKTGWVEEPTTVAPVIRVVGRTPSASH